MKNPPFCILVQMCIRKLIAYISIPGKYLFLLLRWLMVCVQEDGMAKDVALEFDEKIVRKRPVHTFTVYMEVLTFFQKGSKWHQNPPGALLV